MAKRPHGDPNDGIDEGKNEQRSHSKRNDSLFEGEAGELLPIDIVLVDSANGSLDPPRTLLIRLRDHFTEP